jgi:tryptophanase
VEVHHAGERAAALARAHYNVFQLPADDVLIRADLTR